MPLSLKHDFSAEFPGLFSKDDFISQKPDAETDTIGLPQEVSASNQIWKDRYISLLESYNKVLMHYTTKGNPPFVEPLG
jgi:hypothetical protein